MDILITIKDKEMINILANIIGSAVIGGGAKVYTPIPSPPSLTSPFTLNTSAGGTIESGETGGSRNLLVPDWNNTFIPNGLVGTSASPYQFKSVSDTTRSWIGGSAITAGQQIIDALNNSNFCYFYHLGLVGNPDPTGVQGVSGITWRAYDPAVRKSTAIFNDLIIRDMSASIAQINDATIGSTYDYIEFKYVRGFGYSGIQAPGANGSQEGFYQGSTSTSFNAESRYTSSVYQHCLIVNKGREGFQFNNHVALNASKLTCINVGQTLTAGQNHLIQVQNCNGIIQDSIFYNAPAVMNLACQGMTFRNCSFYFDGTQGNVLRMGDFAHYNTSPMKNGQPVLFDQCYFHSFQAITNMLDVREDQANVTFTNCTKNSNITNLYVDNRTDKVTFTLSNTGTTTANNPIPTFQSILYTDESTHGLVTSSYHYNLHQGYRTP